AACCGRSTTRGKSPTGTPDGLSGLIGRRSLLSGIVGLPGTHDVPQRLRAATYYVGGKRSGSRGAAGRGAPACGSWTFPNMPPAASKLCELIGEMVCYRKKAFIPASGFPGGKTPCFLFYLRHPGVQVEYTGTCTFGFGN